MWTYRRSGAVLLVGALALAGCDESGTGPELNEDFDSEAALSDYEALDDILGADALAGFHALNGRTPFSSGSAAAAAVELVAGLDAHGPAPTSREFALDLLQRARAVHGAPPVAAAPIISNWTRGATYVYDPGTDRYALAAGRTGAPATGVRFVLYDVDEAGRPLVDREVGYADLIDQGDDSQEDIALRLLVVVDETPLVDYRTTLDERDGTGTLTVDGFLKGPNQRLDFDIVASGSDQGGREVLNLDFGLHVEARGFHIEGQVRGLEEEGTGEGSIDITVRHGRDTLRLDVEASGGELNGAVTANGELFASVSGPEDDPTFTSGDGDPLTGTEFLVLRHLADAVEDVFDLLEDLVDPVDELVILGLIL